MICRQTHSQQSCAQKSHILPWKGRFSLGIWLFALVGLALSFPSHAQQSSQQAATSDIAPRIAVWVDAGASMVASDNGTSRYATVMQALSGAMLPYVQDEQRNLSVRYLGAASIDDCNDVGQDLALLAEQSFSALLSPPSPRGRTALTSALIDTLAARGKALDELLIILDGADNCGQDFCEVLSDLSPSFRTSSFAYQASDNALASLQCSLPTSRYQLTASQTAAELSALLDQFWNARLVQQRQSREILQFDKDRQTVVDQLVSQLRFNLDRQRVVGQLASTLPASAASSTLRGQQQDNLQSTAVHSIEGFIDLTPLLFAPALGSQNSGTLTMTLGLNEDAFGAVVKGAEIQERNLTLEIRQASRLLLALERVTAQTPYRLAANIDLAQPLVVTLESADTGEMLAASAFQIQVD